MPVPIEQTGTAQFRSLLRSFAFDPALIVDHLLGEEHLARVIAHEIPRTCARIFTPRITLATLLARITCEDHSCQAALDRLLARRAARGLPPASPDTGGYCKARQRLPETLLPRLAREAAERIGAQVPGAWLGRRHRAILADGSVVSMPGTPGNQAAYPRASIQKPGCGFPVTRVMVLIALATGVVLDAAIGRCTGRLTVESTLLRGLHARLRCGDIVLADRYYRSYFEADRSDDIARCRVILALRVGRAVPGPLACGVGPALNQVGAEDGRAAVQGVGDSSQAISLTNYDILLKISAGGAAGRHGALPRRLSFQGARQMLEGSRVDLNGASPEAVEGLIAMQLRIRSKLSVGERPDRYESRVRKRRTRAYPLVHAPRKQWKKLMAKAG